MPALNVLVTGSNGQLGTHIQLKSANSPHHYIFTDVAELDITNRDAVFDFVRDNQIDIIINCAAYTQVDKAESDESAADLINHVAVGFLAEAMLSTDGLLLHISTDYVFGGNTNNIPCDELEPVNPTGAYGRTKLAGEQSIISTNCRYIILRTAWMYSEFGKNFCKTMLQLTESKPALNVVFDQVGTPTYAGDLAQAIVSIVDNQLFEGHEGLYHYSNEGVCSWYDFAMMIAKLSNHDSCRISPCHSCEFPSPVTRPSYSVLDKTKFKETFGISIPYWTDSLITCINNLIK